MRPVERLQAVFAFEMPDRVSVYDKLRNEEVIGRLLGEPFEPARGMEQGLRACRLALDSTANVQYPKAERMESTDDGFEWMHTRWTSWISARPFATVEELAGWVRGEIERLDGWDAAGWLAGKLDWFDGQQVGLGDTVNLFNLVHVGLNDAYHKAGLELFSYLMADAPALVSFWLESAFRANMRILETLDMRRIPHRFAQIGEDIACNTGTLFSPAFLRREFFPRVKELVGALHDLGFKVTYHSDGNMNAVMDDLVEAGIDGFNPIEIAAGMDLADLKARYGRRLVLVGGMDASELLPRGSVDEVRVATRRALEIGMAGSGYILGSTTELNNAIPPENILAMWEVASTYRI
jgi:hypothetical protein